jgi:hypothetical protein
MDEVNVFAGSFTGTSCWLQQPQHQITAFSSNFKKSADEHKIVDSRVGFENSIVIRRVERAVALV